MINDGAPGTGFVIWTGIAAFRNFAQINSNQFRNSIVQLKPVFFGIRIPLDWFCCEEKTSTFSSKFNRFFFGCFSNQRNFYYNQNRFFWTGFFESFFTAKKHHKENCDFVILFSINSLYIRSNLHFCISMCIITAFFIVKHFLYLLNNFRNLVFYGNFFYTVPSVFFTTLLTQIWGKKNRQVTKSRQVKKNIKK